MTPVHEIVENVRLRKGVTKAHIARRCGHTISWYHDISKGRRNLSVTSLQKIAEALEVPVAIFFEQEVSDSRHESANSHSTA